MTLARATVIVVSSSAKSYFLEPPTRIVANGARRYSTFEMPIAFAISRPRLYSKPVPFLMVVPEARPSRSREPAGRSRR